MEKALLDRVKNTRTTLREQALETIFNEFDVQCMNLDHSMRAEKYKQMTESPFRFFRGSAYLFYYDMTKIPFSFHTPADKPTWIQGDLHLENFGAFQNEKGEIVFDVNDFDEGYIGSYLYDVLRMSVSITLFCESLSLNEKEQKARILTYLQAYYDQLKRFTKNKDNPYRFMYTKKNSNGPVQKVLKKLVKRQRNHLLQDITYINDENKRVFAWSQEIQPVNEGERVTLQSVFEEYIHTLDAENKQEKSFYNIKDIARKSGSGTASIGLDRYYILIEGGKEAGGMDDLVLEIKEVRTPIPAYFLPYREKFWDLYQHQGERVVNTQKAMHHLEDPYLGYLTMNDRDYYVRERSPYKKKIKAKQLKNIEDIDATLEIMGRITAKIHSRADVDFMSDLFTHHSEKEIVKAIGDHFDIFCTQIIFTSMVYKDQVKNDYELFCKWHENDFAEQEFFAQNDELAQQELEEATNPKHDVEPMIDTTSEQLEILEAELVPESVPEVELISINPNKEH